MSAELSVIISGKRYSLPLQNNTTKTQYRKDSHKKHKTDAPSIINIFKKTNTPKIDTIKVRLSEC